MNFSRLLGSLLGSAGGGMLGGMVGGRGGRMVGSILGSLMGSRGVGRKGGGLLGKMMGGGDDNRRAQAAQYTDQEDQQEALLLIRAMCNAAKCDGEVSQEELDVILSRLGELDPEEEEFLRTEFSTPLDVDAFVREVPSDMAVETYAVSLMAIKVDTGEEQRYLAQLANGLGLDDDTRRDIHERLDAPWVND